MFHIANHHHKTRHLTPYRIQNISQTFQLTIKCTCSIPDCGMHCAYKFAQANIFTGQNSFPSEKFNLNYKTAFKTSLWKVFSPEKVYFDSIEKISIICRITQLSFKSAWGSSIFSLGTENKTCKHFQYIRQEITSRMGCCWFIFMRTFLMIKLKNSEFFTYMRI